MERIWVIIIFGWFCITTTRAQQYSSSSIFAHNDYAQESPFYAAHSYRVGHIEADIFLKQGELMVAHHRNEIQRGRTLSALYLAPLKREIIKNNGWPFADTTLRLSLMIDLKTEGSSTLQHLVDQLSGYPELISCPVLEIVISGNVPSPNRWNEFPSFIHFDGRPGISYTVDQLKRVSLISTNFREHSRWEGEGTIPSADMDKLEKLIQTVHTLGKKIRFWAAPDVENGWATLMKLKVDVLGTDNVPALATFLGR